MDEIIYSLNGKSLKTVSVNILRKDVIVKEGTKIIKKEAFQNVYFKSITFPESLTKIEKYAFNNSALKELIIKNKINIEEEAFINNYQLQKIDINCEIIPSWCFFDCGKPNFSEENGFEVILENTKAIKDNAFSYCHINNFYAPNLKYIYPKAFIGATFKNTHLYLPDNILIIGNDVFKNTNLTDIYLPQNIRLIHNLQDQNINLHMSRNTFERLNIEKSDNIFFIKEEELYKNKTFKEINNINKNKNLLLDIDVRELKKFL